MFCIVAFVILAVLGIFSAARRELAREALNCVLRRVTLRPCNTGFDEKMKAKILGALINRSETAARIFNRNFELIAWIFFLLMLGSTVFAARGLYLFYTTGSCNGVNAESFCLLDPGGEHNRMSPASGTCPLKRPSIADLTLKNVGLAGFPAINGGGRGRIVMIGCYGCSYSRRVYPLLKELAQRSGAEFIFIDYPTKVKSDLMTRYGQCVYDNAPAVYWRLNDQLFATAAANLDDPAFAAKKVAQLGLNSAGIRRCADAPATREKVARLLAEAVKTNFYGTPTVFVNGRAFVGPKPYRVYAIQLQGLLYWLK